MSSSFAGLMFSKYGLEDKEVCVNNVTLNSGDAQRTVKTGKSGVDSVYAVTGLTSKTVVEGTSKDGSNVGENAEEVVSQINKISGNNATAIGEIYTWNQKSGQKASSSGTIYGIYDLSGGVWERTATYIANNSEYLSYGNSLLYNGSTTEEKSTKYVMVYAHDLDSESSSKNYEVEANKRRFGNAMHETSTTGTGSTSWFGNCSCFVELNDAFSYRGGYWFDGNSTGLFYFNRTNATSNYAAGLRAVLVGM